MNITMIGAVLSVGQPRSRLSWCVPMQSLAAVVLSSSVMARVFTVVRPRGDTCNTYVVRIAARNGFYSRG